MAVKAHAASGDALDNEVDGGWKRLPPSAGSAVLSRFTKKTLRASSVLPPCSSTKTSSLQKHQPITPLSRSVQEVPAAEDEI